MGLKLLIGFLAAVYLLVTGGIYLLGSMDVSITMVIVGWASVVIVGWYTWSINVVD